MTKTELFSYMLLINIEKLVGLYTYLVQIYISILVITFIVYERSKFITNKIIKSFLHVKHFMNLHKLNYF